MPVYPSAFTTSPSRRPPINTHGHFDHVGGNKGLKDATDAQILIHPLDAHMLDEIASHGSAWGFSVENSPKPDRTLEDGDTVSFGKITFLLLEKRAYINLNEIYQL